MNSSEFSSTGPVTTIDAKHNVAKTKTSRQVMDGCGLEKGPEILHCQKEI